MQKTNRGLNSKIKSRRNVKKTEQVTANRKHKTRTKERTCRNQNKNVKMKK